MRTTTTTTTTTTTRKRRLSYSRRSCAPFLVLLFTACNILVGFHILTDQSSFVDNQHDQSTTTNEKQQDKAVPSSTLSFKVDPLVQREYERIDSTIDRLRCARYGLGYNAGQTRRRIFFGSMVADENLDVIRMHATETYGIYHVVSLIESNRTHSRKTARTLRFAVNGTAGFDLVHNNNGGIFGPRTTVYTDLHSFDPQLQNAGGMDAEELQREWILKRWKQAGMRSDDLGLMADMDETFTRDFLRAAQICDVPQFRLGRQSCRAPKVFADSLVFESSPECVSKRGWYHPDLILGECIEGIGDSQGRPVATRKYKEIHGEREKGWGSEGVKDYPFEVIASGKYPLSNGADFRIGVENFGKQKIWFFKWMHLVLGWKYTTGYHFHNFFTNVQTLRHKYNTYGHPLPVRQQRSPLSDIHETDLDMMVRCARNLPNSANPTSKARYEGGFDSYVGSKPIFFLDEAYRKERHEQLIKMVEEDEKLYGSKYPASTKKA